MSQSPIEVQKISLKDTFKNIITRAKQLLTSNRDGVNAEIIPKGQELKKEDIEALDTFINGADRRLKLIDTTNTQTPDEQLVVLRSIKAIATSIDGALKALEAKYKHISPLNPEEINFRFIQKEYYELFASLHSRAKSQSVVPSNDKMVVANWKLLKIEHGKFLTAFEKGASVIDIGTAKTLSEKIKVFKQVVDKLGIYNDQFNILQSRLDTRLQALDDYRKAIKERDEWLRSGETSLKDARNFIKSADRKLLGGKIDAISKKIDEVVKALRIIKKDYTEDATKPLNEVAKTCKKEVEALGDLVSSLDIAVEMAKHERRDAVKDQVKQIQLDIDMANRSFRTDYDNLSAKVDKEGSFSKDLKKLSDKLDEIYGAKPENQEPVKFATKKLEEVLKKVEELKQMRAKQETLIAKKIASEQKQVQDKIKREIVEVESEILASAKAFLVDKKFEEYKFSDSEESALAKVKSYLVSPSSGINPNAVENVESVTKRRAEVLAQKKELHDLIRSLSDIIESHNIARNSVIRYLKLEGQGIQDLIDQLNGKNGSSLLAKMVKYFTEQQYTSFIKVLSQNLGKLENNGLQAVRDLNHNQSTPIIKRKLEFIDKLNSKGIDYKDFLNKDHVIDAVSELSKTKLDEFITVKHLQNDSFCKALLKVKDLIDLSPELVKKLFEDESSCVFINQYASSESLYDNKSLIVEYLTTDQKEIIAFRNFKEKIKIDEDCQLPLLKLIKMNPDLKEILSNNHHVEWNIAFLSPFFKDVRPDSAIFTPGILPHTFYAFHNLKIKNDGYIDKQNHDDDLKKIGIFMKGINEIIATSEKALNLKENMTKVPELQKALTGLIRFRHDAMFVLVDKKPIAEKRHILVRLANEHLKHTNWFDRIIEIIGKFCGSTSEKLFSKTNINVKSVIDATKFKGGSGAAPTKQGTGDLTNQFKGKYVEGRGDDASPISTPGSNPSGTKG